MNRLGGLVLNIFIDYYLLIRVLKCFKDIYSNFSAIHWRVQTEPTGHQHHWNLQYSFCFFSFPEILWSLWSWFPNFESSQAASLLLICIVASKYFDVTFCTPMGRTAQAWLARLDQLGLACSLLPSVASYPWSILAQMDHPEVMMALGPPEVPAPDWLQNQLASHLAEP